MRTGHDGAVYLPTLLPIDAKGEIVAEGDIVGQYFACLERGAELLELAGLSLVEPRADHRLLDARPRASATRRSAVRARTCSARSTRVPRAS